MNSQESGTQTPTGKIDRLDTYRHYKGRESQVEILEERRIGGGGVGEVFEVKALIKGHERTFVLKRFFDREECSGQDMARRAFEHYAQAKQAGLKVFPTYRLNEKNSSILMTAGHNEEWHCISANNRGSDSLVNFGAEKLEEIPDFEQFAHAIFAESKKAADAGIFLPADSFFFMVNKHDQKMDFYVGDVDEVQKIHPQKTQSLFEMNITQADAALNFFIMANVA
ncbi:hypothetical protein KBD34_04445, partial [Patescibacteria group bacterium]|nr:hypothetical protein [Patescibacteria group bacterium]